MCALLGPASRLADRADNTKSSRVDLWLRVRYNDFMKRHAALVGLSQDHHHGLVLARRCISEETTWEQVRATFTEELDPHFDIEERLLLPALGSDPLVDRTLSDHEELRQRLQDRGSLPEFGQLLQEHIRFEERELFERAQNVMSGFQLDNLLAAWPKTTDRSR